MEQEYQYLNFPYSWLGAWESVNGNLDVYIFRGMTETIICLLTYHYDRECGRGSFSCYDMDSDEEGWYIRMGMKLSARADPKSYSDSSKRDKYFLTVLWDNPKRLLIAFNPLPWREAVKLNMFAAC